MTKPEQIPIKDRNKKIKMVLDGFDAKEIDENQATWKLEKNSFLVVQSARDRRVLSDCQNALYIERLPRRASFCR